MKRINTFVLSCFIVASCQSLKKPQEMDAQYPSAIVSLDKPIVPILINSGPGYSWHRHLKSAQLPSGNGFIGNHVENMVLLQEQDKAYVAAIENVQKLTSTAKKWVVIDTGGGKSAAILKFAILDDKGWASGFISQSGEVKIAKQSLFTGEHFNQLIDMKPFVCTSNIIHVNTMAVSFGDNSYQKDFNFYDEGHIRDGGVKCPRAEGDLVVLNEITELFAFSD